MSAHGELEIMLKNKIKKVKLVHFIIAVSSLAVGIVFFIVRENTKEIFESDFPIGISGYTSIRYNPVYSAFMGAGFGVAAIVLIMLTFVCIISKVDTVEAAGSFITLYRGAFSIALYVDGKKADKSGYFLEAPLRDGSTVTVSLSRNMLFAHMTFSNGQRPIDL